MNTSLSSDKNWIGHTQSEGKSLRQKKLMRSMMKTVVEYNLIKKGDHIMVAVSGGKDSYTLLDLLMTAKKKAPFHFDITAVHLDQVQPGYEGKCLEEWLKNNQIPHKIIKEDTYSIVVEKSKPGATYCALCSRLRRGILYRVAEEIGANKVALGHHLDDSIETLFLNLIYTGKMCAMPPKYVTDDGRFMVIRPLIETLEKDIIAYANKKQFPIIPCNLCGSQEGLKRQKIKSLLSSLEEEKSDVKTVMMSALKNISVTHLMDPKYLQNEESLQVKKRLHIIQ